LLLQFLDTTLDETAVRLQLGLTGTSGTYTTAQPLQVGPLAHKPWQQVLVLCQFHLKLAFPRVSVATEHIKDQGGAVDDFHLEGVFQGPLLRWVEFVVADDCAGLGLPHQVL
jgi:hypothetical protein